MIHPETHPVTPENGPRPAGLPTECFYCRVALGAEHEPDCVLRKRTVVVRASTEYVIRVPEHWDEEAITFRRNLSTWCANNGVREVGRLIRRITRAGDCACGHVAYTYVREATASDEARLSVETSSSAVAPPAPAD